MDSLEDFLGCRDRTDERLDLWHQLSEGERADENGEQHVDKKTDIQIPRNNKS